MPAFPFVDCDNHGGPLLGYAVCVHVLDGATIDHIVDPSTADLGEVLCAACVENSPDVSRLKLICARCMDAVFAERPPRVE